MAKPKREIGNCGARGQWGAQAYRFRRIDGMRRQMKHGRTGVLGQPTLNSEEPITKTLDSGSYYPDGLAFGPWGELWVSDSYHQRVGVIVAPMSGDTFALSVGAPAKAVPGMPLSASSVAVDPVTGKVFVADETASAVLRFGKFSDLQSRDQAELTYTFAGSAPDFVFVDRNGTFYCIRGYSVWMDTNAGVTFGDDLKLIIGSVFTSGCSATLLNVPRGLYADGSGNLWVADAENERVCYYKKNALGQFVLHRVLGQPNATSSADHTASPHTLRHPQGVTLDSAGRLWIADTDNSRIVRYDNAVNQPAHDPVFSAVLGQADFFYYGQGSPADELNRPRGVTCDLQDRLWIADTENNRVVRYDHPAGFGQHPAQLALGQYGFNINIPNDTTLRGLQSPAAVSIDPHGCLWVADSGNGRVLRHTPDDPVTLPASKISSIFRAQWGVEPGVFYRVQVSGNLKSWLAAGSLTAQSSVAQWQDFITSGASVFFRIVGP